MLELAAIFVTAGAMLYRMGTSDLVVIGYGALVVAVAVMLLLRSRQGIIAGILAGCLIALGALTLWKSDVPVPDELFGMRAFDARVVSVDRRLTKTHIVVVVPEYDKKIQLITQERVSLLPGDNLTVRGEVRRPEDFVTETGRIFEYRAYLKSKEIVAIIRDPIIGPVTSRTFSPARIPTTIRYWVAALFSRYITFPFDGVVAGMLVGYQGGIPQSIQDLFRDTGVLHVLVLSGYNITLLAGFLGALLKGLPFRVRTVVTMSAIVLLVLISGAGVASVRAGIMGSIALVAGLSIRTYRPLRALTVAYLGFFFVSPTSLFVDPGFHLSFLATLFMVQILPKVEALFRWIPSPTYINIREVCMLACSVPLFMLPYMMYFSGTVPLSSAFANILFAIIAPIVMVCGIALIVLSWITPLAGFVGILLSGLGDSTLWFLRWCDTLPIWQTPPLAWWGVVGIYGATLLVLFRGELSEFVSQLQKALRRPPSS